MSAARASAAFGLLCMLLFPFLAGGQTATPCNQYQSGSTPPQGYGAAWNVLTSQRELLVSAECRQDGTTFTAGSGASNQYVYKMRYGFSQGGSRWIPSTYSGQFAQGSTDWLQGRGTFEGDLIVSDPFHWVAYVCQWNGTAWKCGCRDAACTTSHWQLQASSNPFAGGTTGGTTTGGSTSGGTTGGTGGGTGGTTLPSPTRTINVANQTQLASALGNAAPGDHIVLANGTYNGFTLTRSGTQANPIIIRAANLHQATFTSRLVIQGDDVWIVGFRSTATMVFHKNRNRATRNFMQAQGNAFHLEGTARNASIDHNDVDSQATPATVAWNGVRVDVNAANLGHKIFRNYFHDAAAVSGAAGGDDNGAVQLGYGGARLIKGGVIVEYNLISNWLGDAETISTKTSGHIIRHNTILNSKFFFNRGGFENQYIANWFEPSSTQIGGGTGIAIYDKDNRVIGNRGMVLVCEGTDDPDLDVAADGSVRQASQNTLVAGNIGKLHIGQCFFPNDDLGAMGTKVEAHQTGNACGQGSITCDGAAHTGTQFSQSASVTVPQAVKLTQSLVGPNAPTAPR